LVVDNYPVSVSIVHEPVVVASTVVFVAVVTPTTAGTICILIGVHESVTVSATNFNLSTAIATA
jgi:hypothetical protein